MKFEKIVEYFSRLINIQVYLINEIVRSLMNITLQVASYNHESLIKIKIPRYIEVYYTAQQDAEIELKVFENCSLLICLTAER